MRRYLVWGLTVAVAALVIMGRGDFGMPLAPAAADGESRFTSETLKGSWGFTDAGQVVPPAADQAIPFVSVGQLEINGRGGCTGSDYLNVNGLTLGPRMFDTCNYSVNRDGTGTLTATAGGDPNPITLHLVIVEGGNEFRYIIAGALVGDGVARRQ